MPECKLCKGTGSRDQAPPYSKCPSCDGWGRITETEPAWYVPLLAWCSPGRFIVELALGRQLHRGWRQSLQVAWIMRKGPTR